MRNFQLVVCVACHWPLQIGNLALAVLPNPSLTPHIEGPAEVIAISLLRDAWEAGSPGRLTTNALLQGFPINGAFPQGQFEDAASTMGTQAVL